MIPNVKVKKLDEAAIVPTYAKAGDAGADLYALENKTVFPGDTKLIKTGIAIELPDGYEAQVRSRSGLALKKSVHVLNSPGTVDQTYRGDVGVILRNDGKEPFCIIAGDRIAQMVVKPVLQATFDVVNELSETDRGEGGFGSTGVS